MAEERISKLELAERQLETAIMLFVSRRDRVSAITLAGAADGILHGLVIKAGKKPFADMALGVAEALSGKTPAKAKYAKLINDQLKINDLKHMDREDGGNVTLDVSISALGSILKAIANHHSLVPEHPEFIHYMLRWTWMFYDGEKIREDEPYVNPAGEKVMEWYADRPERIQNMEKRWAMEHQAYLKREENSGTEGRAGEESGENK